MLLLLVILSIFVILNLNKIRTIYSLDKVDDYPLYSMRYYGDYHLNYDAATDISITDASTALNEFDMMCSCFLTKNEKGNPIFAEILITP